MTAYDSLVAELREIGLLSSVRALLDWDEQTQMPPKGAEQRAEQASLLAKLVHARLTSARVGGLLDEAAGAVRPDGDDDASVNVRETRRTLDRARKLPPSLVEELARTTVLAQQAWAAARKKDDYPAFRPWLEKILGLKRQEADCVGYASGNRYDALLDEYEPTATAAQLKQTFNALRGPLVELVRKIAASPRKAPLDILQRHFPVAPQEKFARSAAAAIGFDFDAGRLDTSAHPFCSGIAPGDTRMTTRYDPHYFPDAFFSVLHETGHALYDQGLPARFHGTPRAEARSLGIHESQSRMWENLVGRSRAFWRHFLPLARQAFPQPLAGVSDDDWYFAVNDVRPSLVRTEADEVTYNLHVMLRFELEQAMLAGDVAPADVPAAWNHRMGDYLGLTPPDDASGCLQDIHWSAGLYGYLPTYTLANLYPAQFFEQPRHDLGDLDAQFSRGEFAALLSWLRTHIHTHGKRYLPSELIRRTTGQPLSPAPLLRHLRQKAADLYGVN